MIAQHSAWHGKRYVIFMQPDLYTTSKALTREEQTTKARFVAVSNGVGDAFPRYHADLQSSLGTVPNVSLVDLRGLFDDVSEPLFIDDCHLVDRGYQRIADAIRKQLF